MITEKPIILREETRRMIDHLLRRCKKRGFQNPRKSSLAYALRKSGESQMTLPLGKV